MQSPQGPRWYSLSLSQTAGPCLCSEPSDFERGRKRYYHIITGVIRALFGAHAALRGLGSVLERHSFSDRAFIYLQYIVPSFPQCFPPSPEASRSPVSVPVQQRMRCSGEQEGKARKRESPTEHRQTQQVLHWLCLLIPPTSSKIILKLKRRETLSDRMCIILVHRCYKCAKKKNREWVLVGSFGLISGAEQRWTGRFNK